MQDIQPQSLLAMFRREWRVFGLLFLVVMAVIILVTVLQKLAEPPKLLSFTPEQGAQQVFPTTPITLVFSKKVDMNLVRVSLLPNVGLQPAQQNSTTLTFTPHPALHTNTTYTAVAYYKDKVIQQITFKSLEAQSDPTILLEAQQWSKDNYPLDPFLPVATKQYKFFYMKAKTIGAYKYDTTMTDDQLQQIIADFMRQHNVEPTSHTITILPTQKDTGTYVIQSTQ